MVKVRQHHFRAPWYLLQGGLEFCYENIHSSENVFLVSALARKLAFNDDIGDARYGEESILCRIVWRI